MALNLHKMFFVLFELSEFVLLPEFAVIYFSSYQVFDFLSHIVDKFSIRIRV